MARLQRVTSKVFAENATEVGQFGSLNAGTKVTTTDIAEIQALPAWQNGWQAAAIGKNCYPTLQERNGLDKVQSYFLNYLLQEGIAEWDSGTTYYTGSIVKLINGADVRFYQSLKDNNTAALSNTNSWKEFKSGGSGLEICDIGMALYVDETKGLRRYLNGQIVDINTNTQAFLDRLKQITTLHPSLLCTEEEWQTAKTMSAFGQVGKFVFNYSGNEVVSVRIPRVVHVQGLFDLQNLGMTVGAGLPNITGTISSVSWGGKWSVTPSTDGAFNITNDGGTVGHYGTSYNQLGGKLSFNASLSNSIYGKSETIQQEAIQYPYFIQIATGSETENNIINEIELNNPYSLFDSKYSDHELNNLSWLKSEGQWNAKAVYPTAYDKLLKVYNGTETVEGLSVKLSTETYTDYDFVLNTADETFRLPLKNHTADDSIEGLTLYFYVGETVQNANLIDAGRIGEKISALIPENSSLIAGYSMPSNKYIDLTLGASGTTYTAPADGWFYLYSSSVTNTILVLLDGSGYGSTVIGASGYTNKNLLPVKKNTIVQITYGTASGTGIRFIYAQGSESEAS